MCKAIIWLQKMKDDNTKGVTIDGKHYTGYDATQRQRQLERRIRYWKRQQLAAKSTGDTEQHLKASGRLTNAKRAYKEFSDKANLPMQNDRLYTAGWNKSAKDDILSAQHLDKFAVTQEAIEKAPYVKVPGFSTAENQMLQQEHKELLRLAQQQALGIEVAKTFVGQKYSNAIYGVKELSVQIPDYHTPYNAMHSHPGGGTLSHQDIVLFTRRPNMGTLSVVGHDGDVFILTKTTGYDKDAFRLAATFLNDEVNRYLADDNLFDATKAVEKFLEEAENYGAKYITGNAK